jgi:heme-degrading monooxygenase HmoA
MIAILWSYRVRPECRPTFEAIYSPQGDWARLFARSPGYEGTELLRQGDGGYVTIDRWRQAAAFDKFKDRFRADYEALDRLCESLTLEERFLGRFEVYAGAAG